MATYTPVPIKIAEKDTEQKSNARTRLPLDLILNFATNAKTGYVEWPALVEQLLLLRVCKTKIAAAVYIRQLIDTRKLHQVPCASTGTVCFSREQIKNSVAITAEDERKIKNQTAQYVKELSHKTQLEDSSRKRRNENLRRRYLKDREELLRK